MGRGGDVDLGERPSAAELLVDPDEHLLSADLMTLAGRLRYGPAPEATETRPDVEAVIESHMLTREFRPTRPYPH